MKQLSFTIHSVDELDKVINDVRQDRSYNTCSDCLAQIFMGIIDFDMAVRVHDELRAGLPRVKIAGLSSSIEILDGQKSSGDILISFLFLEMSHVTVRQYDCINDMAKSAAFRISDDIDSISDAAGAIIFFDSFSVEHPESFYANIRIQNHDLPIAGACASLQFDEDGRPGQTFVIADNVSSGSVAVVIFSGPELHAQVSETLGWVPVGRKHIITAIENQHILKEIDDEPAIDTYNRYLGLDEAPGSTEQLSPFPLIVSRNGMNVARAVINTGHDNNLIMPADVRLGEEVQLSIGNITDILRESRNNSKSFEKLSPEYLFVCVCINRESYLKTEEQSEIDYYKAACRNVIGCSAFGEMMHIDGYMHLLNCALVAFGLREGALPANPKEIVFDQSLLNTTAPLFDRMVKFLQISTREYIELKEQEKAMELEQKLLIEKAQNDAKSIFLSNLSHEIRTPINAIAGLNEMILRTAKDEEILGYAQDIKNANKTLLALIDDLLDISRIAAGKLEIHSQPYSLSAMLRNIYILMSNKASSKDLDISFSVNPEIPDKLEGDEKRISQVLLNLIDNAIKYTDSGRIALSVLYHQKSIDQIDLICHVMDTGMGMHKDDKPNISNPFGRIYEEQYQHVDGAGVGLPLTEQLLELMDSKLEWVTEYGRGSDFFFTIPQNIIDHEPIGDFDEKELINSSIDQPEPEHFRAPNATILVVDDTPINITVVKNLLKRTQVKVDSAANATEAISYAGLHHADLILMDQKMPEIDGTTAMKRIRALGPDIPCAGVPIVVLTANVAAGMKEKFIAEGFDGYLPKPVNPDDLERELIRLLPPELVSTTYSEEADDSGNVVTDNDSDSGDGGDLKSRIGSRAIGTLISSGIFISTGIDNCGGIEYFLPLLSDFSRTYEETSELLRKYVRENDIENYTIKVHSLKSSSRLVGAMKLSEMAKYLEECGDNNQMDNIVNLNEELLDEFKKVTDAAFSVFGEESDSDKPEAEDFMLTEAGEAILEYVRAFDFESVESIINELDRYRMPAEFKDDYKKLKQLIKDVAHDEIIEMLEHILHG